jgi:hypothetical protein
MFIFFSFFFSNNNQIFQDQALLFVYQFGNQEEKFKNTLFYIYIAARSRIQQEHYLMILCSTIQEDTKTLFFLIYVAENNQERKTNQETKDIN